jgi:hypothetical protein
MADEHAKRPTDPRGSFGHETKRRITQTHASPGVAKDAANAASGQDGHHPPPLARSVPDSTPLRERFQRGRD